MAVQGTDERYAIESTAGIIVRMREILADINLRLTRSEARDGVVDQAAREIANQGVRYIESVISPRAAELEALLEDFREGVPADAVVEGGDRLFWTAARAAALMTDLLGGVSSDGDTLAKLYGLIATRADAATVATAIAGIRGTADAAHDTLGELATLVDAAAAAAAANATAIAGKADAEATTAALGNRLRLDAAGGYSDALKGQGRANLLGAPLVWTTSGAILAAHVGCKARLSGTITRTLPAISGVSPAWATDVYENTGTGIVTVAAGAGDAFEGVTAGSLALLPKQRVYIYLDTDGWHVGWIDRTPVLASAVIASGQAVAALDLAVPVGFSRFTLDISGAQTTATNANLTWRTSDGDATAFKVGASDYRTQNLVAYGTTVASSVTDASYGTLATNTSGASLPGQTINGRFDFYPGEAGTTLFHKMVGRVFYTDPVQNISGNFDSLCFGGTSGAPGRCKLLRISPTSGLLFGGFFLRGLA